LVGCAPSCVILIGTDTFDLKKIFFSF